MIGGVHRSTGRFNRRSVVLVGGANLVLGTLGFIPGLTTDIDQLRLAGSESQALIGGVFQTSVLLNAVHLSLGIWAVLAAKRERSAQEYLIANGVISLSVHILDHSSVVELTALNTAARWLHVVLAALTITLALISTSHHRVGPPPPNH